MNFASYVVLAIVGVLFVLAVRYVLSHGGSDCGGQLLQLRRCLPSPGQTPPLNLRFLPALCG